MNGLLTMSYVAPSMPHLTPNPPTSGVVVDPLDPQHALRSPPSVASPIQRFHLTPPLLLRLLP